MALVLRNLTTVYQVQGREEVAIQGINLEVKSGEFVGILGRSGAGKSTLIRSINRLVTPTQGTILWKEDDVTKLSGKALHRVRREMGIIFQQFQLIPRLTVLQNCILGCFGYRPFWKNMLGIISREEKQRAMQALKRVEMDHLADKRVEQLSGGQQQRVAIARVLMQAPKLLLGDEPVASLDPVITNQVMSLIKEVHETQQMTTIISLHDVDLALTYCDRIIGLAKGKLVFDGLPSEVNSHVLDEIYANQQDDLQSEPKSSII